jgi:hypothetical protein
MLPSQREEQWAKRVYECGDLDYLFFLPRALEQDAHEFVDNILCRSVTTVPASKIQDHLAAEKRLTKSLPLHYCQRVHFGRCILLLPHNRKSCTCKRACKILNCLAKLDPGDDGLDGDSSDDDRAGIGPKGLVANDCLIKLDVEAVTLRLQSLR